MALVGANVRRRADDQSHTTPCHRGLFQFSCWDMKSLCGVHCVYIETVDWEELDGAEPRFSNTGLLGGAFLVFYACVRRDCSQLE